MVEMVVGEIEIPVEGANWREAMRRKAVSAREVLSRHSWADRPAPVTWVWPDGDAINRFDLGNLRAAGFSIEMAAHALWLIDSFGYDQVIQEISCLSPPRRR